MNAFYDHRASKRYQKESPVLLEDFRTGFYYNGTMYNYSENGIYFESNYAPRPGRRIHLKVDGAHHERVAATGLGIRENGSLELDLREAAQ